MISLVLTTLRLLRAVSHGVRTDPDFRSLFALFILMLAGGTMFYSSSEGWSFLDSLYFCVMTMSTIGYGDFVPSSAFSKVFTILYTLVSVGLFAAVVSKMVFHILAVRREDSQAGIAGRRSRQGRSEAATEVSDEKDV